MSDQVWPATLFYTWKHQMGIRPKITKSPQHPLSLDPLICNSTKIKFNGGEKGKTPQEKQQYDCPSRWDDNKMTATNLLYRVFSGQRHFNKFLSPLTADLHCQLQSPRQQRREEPFGPAAVPLERNLQEQRGGWHGPVKPHIVPAWRKTRPLREWLRHRNIMSIMLTEKTDQTY